MAINHRQIEMFRAEAADLPKVLAELHRHYGSQAGLLRIAKVNEQIVAGYALLSPTERQGSVSYTHLTLPTIYSV